MKGTWSVTDCPSTSAYATGHVAIPERVWLNPFQIVLVANRTLISCKGFTFLKCPGWKGFRPRCVQIFNRVEFRWLSGHLSTLRSSVFILRDSSGLASTGQAALVKTQHLFLNPSSQSPRVEFRWPGLGQMSVTALTSRARKVEYSGRVHQGVHQWRQETKSDEWGEAGTTCLN